MRLNEYTFKFLLLVIAQILLWNFFNFSQYLTLTLLPAMMLTLPHNRSALYSMPLALTAARSSPASNEAARSIPSKYSSQPNRPNSSMMR